MADDKGDPFGFEDLDLPGQDLGEADLFQEPVADDSLPSDAAEEPLSGEALEEVEPSPKSAGKGSLLSALSGASPYTVMLGIALAAILVAIGCLTLELGTYGFEVRP